MGNYVLDMKAEVAFFTRQVAIFAPIVCTANYKPTNCGANHR